MELVYNKSKPVAVTGMAFPTGDVNNYVVGSEEGTVYTASRHGRWGKRFASLCKPVLNLPVTKCDDKASRDKSLIEVGGFLPFINSKIPSSS